MTWKVGTSAWDPGEYVVTINGSPIGQTLRERDADCIARWLRSAEHEIRQIEGNLNGSKEADVAAGIDSGISPERNDAGTGKGICENLSHKPKEHQA